MKSFRHILSNNGILAAAAILMTIAFVLVFVGIGMESQNQLNGVLAPVVAAPASESIVLYVMAGLMGEIPSAAGTFQSYALALAFGLTPVVVLLMFATRAFIKPRANASFHAVTQ